MNDYNVKEYVTTTSILFEFIDDPGEDSKDLRARRCRVKPNPSVSETIWDHIVREDAVVWRGQYECARACQRIISSTDKQEPTLEHINLDNIDETTSSPPKKATGRKRKHSSVNEIRCPVILHVSDWTTLST